MFSFKSGLDRHADSKDQDKHCSNLSGKLQND